MTKQGLLFADAPEPIWELYCSELYIISEEPKILFSSCDIIFTDIQEYVRHRKEFHKQFFGHIVNSYRREPGWYPLDHLEPDPSGDDPTIYKEQPFFLSRPVRRWNVTRQELDYLKLTGKERTCWCGKPKAQWDSKYQRKYCSTAHQDEWTYEKVAYWNGYRDRILREHYETHPDKHQFCDNCGKESTRDYGHEERYQGWNVDHVIAIMNGGHPWRRENLQVLCEPCHKIKTKEDHEYRKENRVEVLQVGQLTLDPEQMTL